MLQLPIYDMAGEVAGQTELRGDIFGAPVSEPLMHQALVRQLANARQGTAKTKTRAEVRGGGRKPWRQKGTGRARHGSIREPQWRGGGIAFGPRPRSYRQAMPRKMRRAALRSALSAKAQERRILLLEELAMEAPKTKEMVGLLGRLGIGEDALILLAEGDRAVERSANNLPRVKALRAQYLNIADLFKYEYLVLPLDSLEVITGILG